MRFYKLLAVLPVLAFGVASQANAGSCVAYTCDPHSEDTSELLEASNGFTRENVGANSSSVYNYFDGKNCFYCDTGKSSAECNYGDIVYIPYGAHNGLYKCTDTGGVDDTWEKVSNNDLEWCPDSPLKVSGSTVANAKNATFAIRELSGGKGKMVSSSKRVAKACKWNECKSGFVAKDNKCISPDEEACNRSSNAKWSGTSCICQQEGRYWSKKKQYCMTDEECRKGDFACLGININIDNNNINVNDVAQNNNNNQQQNQQQQQRQGAEENQNVPNVPVVPVTQSCVNGRTTANGKACCYISSSRSRYDESSDTCVCKTAGETFKIVNGIGYCVGGGNGGNGGNVTPGASDCDCVTANAIIDDANNRCTTKSDTLQTAIMQATALCATPTCSQSALNVYMNTISSIAATCTGSQPVVAPTIDADRVAKAVAAIDKYRSGLDTSVWKDADGNFNTARLVSDSVAGVVLGTAGALITSSVVKKNQIKKGFEDIVCTIGGQEVGSYGDEISVGIR